MVRIYFVRHAQPDFSHYIDLTRPLTDEGKTLVIGTHGTAMSTILNYYDQEFGCEDFLRIIDWMPYIVELDFEGDVLISKTEHLHIEKEFKAKSR